MWKKINESLPEEGKFVETKIDDEHGIRNVQRMKRQGKLWFVSDGTYVYFTPTHWK